MSSGSYSILKDAISLLDETMERTTLGGRTKQDSNETTESTLPSVTEASVLEQFGTSLREVTKSQNIEIHTPPALVMSVRN